MQVNNTSNRSQPKEIYLNILIKSIYMAPGISINEWLQALENVNL